MSFSFGASPSPPPVSPDARAMLLYEVNRFSEPTAFLLLVYTGLFGGHNFYLGRTGAGVAQLVFTCLVVTIFITIIWVIVDAFNIRGYVQKRNLELARSLGAV